MTSLLEKVFQEAQKLPTALQDEIAEQMLEDIKNEVKWQKTFSDPDLNIDLLTQMAEEALKEDEEGKTEDKGFGED